MKFPVGSSVWQQVLLLLLLIVVAALDHGHALQLRSKAQNIAPFVTRGLSVAIRANRGFSNLKDTHRNSLHSTAADTGTDSDDDESADAPSLRGKERRLLRSIAGRLKTSDIDSLVTINYSSKGTNPANVLENIQATLVARELVQLRLDVPKKKEAKVLAETICNKLNCELVQVLGHTALLYKAGVPDGPITRSLKVELAATNANNAKRA